MNGQVVSTASLSDGQSDYDLTYTPTAGSSGSVQLTATATDSVLYQGSDTRTITLTSSPVSFKSQGTSGKNNGGGNGRGGSNTASYVFNRRYY